MELQKVELAVNESGYLYAIKMDGTVHAVKNFYGIIAINEHAEKIVKSENGREDKSDTAAKAIKSGKWCDGFTQFDAYCCGKCGQILKPQSAEYVFNYCPKCGIKIDWSNAENVYAAS